LGTCGADAADIPNFLLWVSVVDSLIFSFVVPIEASEFEVEFFLRGVECDTQFAKKRSWSLFFLFFLFRVVRF
jgi:hypothetical protein